MANEQTGASSPGNYIHFMNVFNLWYFRILLFCLNKKRKTGLLDDIFSELIHIKYPEGVMRKNAPLFLRE